MIFSQITDQCQYYLPFQKFLKKWYTIVFLNSLINSTAYALTHLYDKISSAIDNKEYTVGIFIDLSKAFDTVDHCILLEKLEYYGIWGSALNWFAVHLLVD